MESIRNLRFIGSVLFLLVSCISPRQECEEIEDLDGGSMPLMCLLALDVSESCQSKLNAGLVTAEKCMLDAQLAYMVCKNHFDAKKKCEKESPLPIIPKIVWLSSPKIHLTLLPPLQSSGDGGRELVKRRQAVDREAFQTFLAPKASPF